MICHPVCCLVQSVLCVFANFCAIGDLEFEFRATGAQREQLKKSKLSMHSENEKSIQKMKSVNKV